MPDTLLTTGHFAALVERHINTVILWCQNERLPGISRTPGGHYRIPSSYVDLVRAGILPLTEARFQVAGL